MPSYNDSGRHAAQANFHYTNTQDNRYFYTAIGTSKHDGHVYSEIDVVWDSLNTHTPVAGFYDGYLWVPDSSSAWPM